MQVFGEGCAGSQDVLARVSGSQDVLTRASGSQAVFGPDLEPSAPQALHRSYEEKVCELVLIAPTPTTTSPAEPSAESGSPDAFSSSVFYIDLAVYTFAPPKQWTRRVKDLADKGISYPFPDSPGRNFNVLAAGWDMEKGEYDDSAFWKADATVTLSTEVDEVLTMFKKFIDTKQGVSPHWCPDVKVLLAFLQATKDGRVELPSR